MGMRFIFYKKIGLANPPLPLLFFLMIIVSFLGGSAWAASLYSIRVQDAPAKTSILCTLSGAFTYKAFTLHQPSRVVVDLNQTSIKVDINKILLHNNVILRVRNGRTPQGVRLVFDVKKPMRIHTSIGKSPKGPQQILRIDLYPTSVSPITPYKVASIINTQQQGSKAPVQAKHAPLKTLRDVIVVLDPGHGGKDPGAIGPRRNAEKNVVLAIALKLKQLINKQPGMRAVLTRNGDYYVGLRERLQIARRHNADIFVSIHADAFINQHSSGASVFALSQRGATSEAARWLAEKENYSELGGVNLSDLDDRNGVIRTVLLDLSQTATISASLKMGNQVLHHMDKITNLHNRAVEQARFMVLKSPDIPSVLIETGFISNPREEKNLTNSFYQARMTSAIFAGIKQYFWDYPPQGSRIEVMCSSNLHIVRRGESLPAIAARYHVTTAALKSANQLTGLSLKPGQKLSIPRAVA